MTPWQDAGRGLALAAGLAVLIALQPAPAQAEDSGPQGLSEGQEEAVRALVREYLLENPEVLIEALQLYDERRKAEAAERQREAVTAHLGQLAESSGAPVLGNPEGDVLVVEFFDYRCPYCKKVAEDLRQAVREDGNIRLIMMEFPILGPDSLVAAQAALAAHAQGRYEDYHFALMAEPGDITESTVIALAERLGLDLERFRADMASEAIDAEIRRTYELAEALEIGGTPAFVIGERIYPGALSLHDLLQAVALSRENAS